MPIRIAKQKSMYPKPRYKSKSYRRYQKRLSEKYPPGELFAEALYAEANKPGFMRRMLSPPGTVWPKPVTPLSDGFNREFISYNHRIIYDRLLINH